MKKIKKIEIRLNGKTKVINENDKLMDLIKDFENSIKKVAIELNQEIIDKKKLNKIHLKKGDKIEIVHFIGGG